MNILVTGAHGQVGFELQRALAPVGRVVALDRAGCDLADAASIRKAFDAAKPAVVVNAGAYTAVDKAESEVERAQQINAVAPGVIGQLAANVGALVVHYSTDYVFDGTGSHAHEEGEAINPLSVYGRTKAEGERALQASGAPYLVFRTSWVYGVHGKNFVKTILRLAAERDTLDVVADQWGAPTSAALIADITAHVVAGHLREPRPGFPYGIYHLAAGGETSWCELARTAVACAREHGAVLKLAPEAVRAITTAQYPTPARRPANSRLDTRKLQRTFGLHLPDWQEAVRSVVWQLVER